MAAPGDAGMPRQQRGDDRQSVGRAMVSTTKTVQTSAAGSGSVQPASSATIAAGGDNVRRRLSNIFQRPIAGRLLRSARSPCPCTRPRIHGSSCQSPRAQRCWRADGDVVARGKFLDHLDVGREAGAREDALEQIVAQHVLRERGRAAPPRRRRRRRCPCRCRSPRRTGPDRRRTPPTNRDRCRSSWRRCAGTASLPRRPAATA